MIVNDIDDIKVISRFTYDKLWTVCRNAVKIAIDSALLSNNHYVDYIITIDSQDNVQALLDLDNLILHNDEIVICKIKERFNEEEFEEYQEKHFEKILEKLGILEAVKEQLKGYDKYDYYRICKSRYWYKVAERECKFWYRNWYISKYLDSTTTWYIEHGLDFARILIEGYTESDVEALDLPF